jgi:hypothetical protein
MINNPRGLIHSFWQTQNYRNVSPVFKAAFVKVAMVMCIAHPDLAFCP